MNEINAEFSEISIYNKGIGIKALNKNNEIINRHFIPFNVLVFVKLYIIDKSTICFHIKSKENNGDVTVNYKYSKENLDYMNKVYDEILKVWNE